MDSQHTDTEGAFCRSLLSKGMCCAAGHPGSGRNVGSAPSSVHLPVCRLTVHLELVLK